MKKDLTRGSITAALCSFAAPMILGNLLQQAYNLGDTLVVGRCLGDNALAACSRARFSARSRVCLSPPACSSRS